MDMGDPSAWAQGSSALKNSIDAFRSLWGLIREARSQPPSPEQEKVIEQAFGEAEKAAKIAHAQMAQALGYELCRCEFPPTPMLEVGFLASYEKMESKPVFQCPQCNKDTAGPWAFTRTKSL